MEYIKQEGLGHKIQRLYIHWDITTACEYKCSYCYAIKEYKDKWMRPGNWKKQQNVIDEISKAKLPVFLGLLGGEPTSHHKYFEMLELIKLKILHHKDSRLYITTNGNKDIDFFKRHKKCTDGKQYFLFSWHPEYCPDNDKFIEKMYYLKSIGYKIKVNIMLHPASQYWDNTILLIKQLIKDNLIEIHPHYIYSSPHKTVKYSTAFYNKFTKYTSLILPEFKFTDENNKDHLYTDTEIFKDKKNKFKNWNCWNNNYEINLNCDVNQFCFEQKHQLRKDYFKNIKIIEPKKCPHEYCSCDGLLKIKKENNEY